MESLSGPADAGPLHAKQVVDAVLAFIGGGDLLPLHEIRRALEQEINTAGPEALINLAAALDADHGWGFYPPDSLAASIHHRLAAHFLVPASVLRGAEHLAALEHDRVVFVSNHLSYADANVIEALFHRAGLCSWAKRLTALAGPKVFTSRQRRFSSLCFGTIKVPQSIDVASGEATMLPRDVAKAARQAMAVASSRLDAGDALILFGEGTRSRTARMQLLLPAVFRYLNTPETWIVPLGLVGSERLFPVNDAAVRPAEVTVKIGRPFTAAMLKQIGEDKKTAVDAIGVAIADLLPEPYRGSYGGPEWSSTRLLLDTVRRC